MDIITEEQARQILRDAGYFTDNLWHVSDVKNNYKCSDDEAQEILSAALTSDNTFENIWFAINYMAEDFYKLEKINTDDSSSQH
jgi:hypothetical protein